MDLRRIANTALEIALDEYDNRSSDNLKSVIKLFLTSDLHTTNLATLNPNPKDVDIIIIAGDFMAAGTDSNNAGQDFLEKKFFPWCEERADLPIVIIPGNHDKYLFRMWKGDKTLTFPRNVHYLVDSGCTVKGLKIYGTPWCLKDRKGRFEGDEKDLAKAFADIPRGLDILISHTPPYIPGEEIDLPKNNEKGKDGDVLVHEGSKELTEEILKKMPRLVICGHVHTASRKPVRLGSSLVMNVARVRDDRGEEAFKPRIVTFPNCLEEERR